MTQTTCITQFRVQHCFQDLFLNMGWHPLRQIFKKHCWSHITTVNLVPQGLFGGAFLVTMTKLFLTTWAAVVANHWLYFHWAFQSFHMAWWLPQYHKEVVILSREWCFYWTVFCYSWMFQTCSIISKILWFGAGKTEAVNRVELEGAHM